MCSDQIDNNLLLFLDPTGRYSLDSWAFSDGAERGGDALLSTGLNVVLRFSRGEFFNYCVMSLKMLLSRKVNKRKLLFVNDGLLSSVFDASNVSAYRAFAKNHLQKPKTLRQRIIALLPLCWRADTRFLVLFYATPQAVDSNYSEICDLAANDFMFFSNAGGKLLLLTSQTLQTGYGNLVKTTAVPDYIPIMAKEFNTVGLLSEMLGKAGCLPEVGKHLEARGRHFFAEKYIHGENLRERLRLLGGQGDAVCVCSILDNLDEWFKGYHASFSGPMISIPSLYTHLFTLFSNCYGSSGAALLRTGTGLLAQISEAYPGVKPITAHNDLWPGNIVITKYGLTIIDWERATECRAPFFDYFWMIISTTIEWLAGETKRYDYTYAEGVEMFLRCEDSVSCYAHQKLNVFLTRLGIAEAYLPHLLFLFFMEWSVQGFQVLGKQSDMDRLAFDVLLHYAENINTTGICLSSSDPLVRESANA